MNRKKKQSTPRNRPSKNHSSEPKAPTKKNYTLLKVFFVFSVMLMVGTLAFMGMNSFFESKKKSPFPSTLGARSDKRWYTEEQVKLGRDVYRVNCVVCHGVSGVGTLNWKEPLANGQYPPPPLNGSAHTWHHSLPVLIDTLNKGGSEIGGMMPAFEKRLTEAEKLAAIAYIQSLWSPKIYLTWARQVNK